jgi:hypothetical protein
MNAKCEIQNAKDKALFARDNNATIAGTFTQFCPGLDFAFWMLHSSGERRRNVTMRSRSM